MAYFAAGLIRSGDSWSGELLDLDDVDDVSGIADALHELADEPDTALALIEQDDEYCAVVRVTGTDDPRVFVSDEGARNVSRLAALLLDETEPAETDPDVELDDLLSDDEDTDEPDEERRSADGAVPSGDAEIVADLGTSPADLVKLCENEGVLPADVLTRICENAGCLDELETLREE